jgi:hypothetical protein
MGTICFFETLVPTYESTWRQTEKKSIVINEYSLVLSKDRTDSEATKQGLQPQGRMNVKEEEDGCLLGCSASP